MRDPHLRRGRAAPGRHARVESGGGERAQRGAAAAEQPGVFAGDQPSGVGGDEPIWFLGAQPLRVGAVQPTTPAHRPRAGRLRLPIHGRTPVVIGLVACAAVIVCSATGLTGKAIHAAFSDGPKTNTTLGLYQHKGVWYILGTGQNLSSSSQSLELVVSQRETGGHLVPMPLNAQNVSSLNPTTKTVLAGNSETVAMKPNGQAGLDVYLTGQHGVATLLVNGSQTNQISF